MNIYYIELFDYYGDLFTLKQQNYFKDYYFDNLTLQEIADNNNVSRNAVHKNIKEIISKLDDYENKLHLYQNKKNIEIIISDLSEDIKEKIREFI